MRNLNGVKSKMDDLLNYLNNKYSQKNCWLDHTEKIPTIEKYKEIIISYWECGAIALIEKWIFFIGQDDLYWFYDTKNYQGLDFCSKEYAKDISDALNRIDMFSDLLTKR